MRSTKEHSMAITHKVSRSHDWVADKMQKALDEVRREKKTRALKDAGRNVKVEASKKEAKTLSLSAKSVTRRSVKKIVVKSGGKEIAR